MRCRSCQAENAADSVYCDECGAALEAACPACGALNRASAKFCRKCRASLVGGAAAPEPVEPAPHLADKIQRSRSALEGERKQVTVLFADVKGSMDLAETMDAEQWSQIMQGFFRRMVDGVEQLEGYVDKFTGDGIMALFGAPLAHEDHAQRACFAALKLRDAAREYAGEIRSRHGVPFEVRIGLNSGEVVVGRIGDDSRMEFTAQGHTVGLAQRMEALAESGSICLSAHTAALVEGYFELRELGRTPVKGVADPVGLFELEGIGKFRSRLERSRVSGLSTFVGRDRDLALLEAALERARDGNGGQVVGISAEAGTGKSRLCAEFLDRCRARGIAVLEGRGVAHGKRIPMLPMLELWRAFYGITDDDTAPVARAKIAGRLLMMDEGFREDLPILFDILGVPDPDNASPVMDPEQRARRVHGLCKRLLHDPGYRGGRVILLEDLHWFDGASDAFLETFVDSVPATRDLWLLNFRPEYQARWMQRSWYQHVALQSLGADAIRSLLQDHLGSDASVAALPVVIQERTRGNPFYIEEIVQSLVENGHLVGKRGAYRLTTPVASLEVPATVQALLAARIDRLAAHEKDVLQTAAVIGKTFAESLLQHVLGSLAGTVERALTDALQQLTAAEFLYETSLYPRVEFSFKHPLTQEVALRTQLSERRARVHAVVAAALEAGGEGLDERAAEIAAHWSEADNRAAAARWTLRAAKWSALSDVRESLNLWRRARELAPAVEDADERDGITMQACDQILALNWRMGDSEEESAAVFAEGRALAAARGNRAGESLLVGRYGLTRMSITGSAADYVRYGEESLTLATGCGDPVLIAAAGGFAAFGHFHVGDGRSMIARADQVLELTGSSNTFGKSLTGYCLRVGMLIAKVRGLMCLGRLDEAAAAIRTAEEAASESNEQEELTWLCAIVGELAWATGMAGSTIEWGHRGVEIAERLDMEASRVTAYSALATGYLLAGDARAALDAGQEAYRVAIERRAQRAFLVSALSLLAETQLALGDRDAAIAAARESAERGANGGCRQWEARAQIILARALLATDQDVPLAEIEAALDRAEQLARSIDARMMSPHIQETRGRAAAARKDSAVSAKLLREALALYQGMGAEGHAERLAHEIDTAGCTT